MAEKYHISPETGNPNKCSAKPGNCRFGSDDKHYSTKQEARAAYEAINKTETVTLGKGKKKSRAQTIADNISELENRYLNANPKMPWLESHSYDDRYSQMVDVAIATVAKYHPTELLHTILEAEEIDPVRWSSYDSDLAHTISVVHSLWNYRGKIKARPDNLLNPPSDDAGWKDRFNREMAQQVITNGHLMRFSESFYGWEEYDHKEEGHKVVAAFDLKQDHWNEFNGTFASEDDSRSGFSLHVMYDNGKFRKFRYEADLGSIMRGLD